MGIRPLIFAGCGLSLGMRRAFPLISMASVVQQLPIGMTGFREEFSIVMRGTLTYSLVPRFSYSFWMGGEEESLVSTVCTCSKSPFIFPYIPLSHVANNIQRSVTVAVVGVY